MRIHPALIAAAGLVCAATAVIGQTGPNPLSTVDRGRYLAAAGDCAACHTQKGGPAYAGGAPIKTPFGVVYSANITPDPDTGIGSWSAGQFYRALHNGLDDQGHHLYPAFPYNYYTRVTRADSDAIFAYLRTVEPARSTPPPNALVFPFNIRGLIAVWNALFLHPGEFRPDPSRSAQWNRGAYLVEGLGHCGACHTQMNALGAPRESRHLYGGTFEDWFAPDLTANPRTGLGGWSRQDVVDFLKTGRNAHAAASAAMGDVVNVSTSQMSDADLDAMAVYLNDRPPAPTAPSTTPGAEEMRQGEAIFVDNCSACHRMQGQGTPGFFPPLPADANLQQANPATTVHLILAGVQSTPTAAHPTGVSMPAYAWKLSDEQIAAVATYVRNTWGNRAQPVSPSDVAAMRRKVVPASRPTEARPDQMTRPGPESMVPPGSDSRDNGTDRAGRPAGG